MGTTALSVLETRLGQAISDDLEVIVTTFIGAGVTIISTNLQTYDGGSNAFRVDGFVYITDKANIGVQRQISSYATSTGTITVRGANLTTDTSSANLATIRLHRYDRNKYIQAINDTSRELYGRGLFWKDLDVIELVTGNILPNSHFRDWDSSSYPDKYSVTNATAAATTTAGLIRGGNKSALVTASAADGYMYISSNNYPRLLDLMGKTVSFYCWALPSKDDDAFLTIFTIGALLEGEYTADAGTSATQIVDSELSSSVNDYYNGYYVWNATRSLGAVVTDYDGTTKTLSVAITAQAATDVYNIRTAQTLSSTTTCPSGKFTLLRLENQVLNDDLVEVQIRFRVHTNAKTCCFDHARLICGDVQEYLLPTDFANGVVSNIEIQSSGYSDEVCDDLLPKDWSPVHDYDITSDGTDKWLRLGETWGDSYLIRLTGKAPLSTVVSYTAAHPDDTIEISGEYLNTFIAYAKYKLFQAIESPVASQDIGRYESQSAKAYGEFMRLSNIRMVSSPVRMRIK